MTPDYSTPYTVPVIKKDQPDDNYKFLPLPEPSGAYPYHLKLETIMRKLPVNKLVFHLAGDTGSLREPGFQRKVAIAMAKQYENIVEDDRPQFLYHLGDVVYNYGEAEHYASQFFAPYQDYPGPIVAIAGNHDSDVNPASPVAYQSLDAFTTVFCDLHPQTVIFSDHSTRKSMVQPHVYWTLETPLANIIGLHSNVPKYGMITDEQRAWFIAELQTADLERPGKALIVCLHHPPYSADTNHSSSLPMISFLEGAFEATGILPDMILSCHVHNYQRFSKRYSGEREVPYVVAGGGGYDELHPVALTDDQRYTADHPLLKNVSLDNYCDDRHGFLKVTVEKSENGLLLTGTYYGLSHEQPSDIVSLTVRDEFAFRI